MATLMMRGLFDFSAWTVAEREVREGARRWANYRLRVGSGLAGAALLWITINNASGGMGQTGLQLFLRLHCLMLVLIIGIVPAMAADCIARERREGTLGLLFLTPLTARGVVIGKSLAQMLRALTLWLAMLPVLTIPFLTGGVTRSMAFHMLAIEFIVAVICMASGIMASALTKSRNGAYFLAYTFAMLSLAAVAMLETALISPVGPLGQISTWNDLLTDGIMTATGNGANSRKAILYYTVASRFPGYRYARAVPTWTSAINRRIWLGYLTVALSAAMGLLLLAITLGAGAIRKLWKDDIGLAGPSGRLKRLYVPLFRLRYDRQMRRSLDRNPIAWLQQYSWKARVSKWGLCAIFILAESFALDWFSSSGGGYGGLPGIGPYQYQMQEGLTLLLAAVFTFTGVSGFLAEKRSGALELLLVTPISVNQIILGRAWGLWKQFLPAAAILLLGQIGMSNLTAVSSVHWALGRGRAFFLSEGDFVMMFVQANAFVSLPIFATYAALRVKSLIGAAVLTWVGWLLVWISAAVLTSGIDGEADVPCSVIFIFNVLYVGLTFFLLRHSLSRRIYSF